MSNEMSTSTGAVATTASATTAAADPLPAFLRRRDGRLEMVLHATWLQDWSRCQTRFAYSYDVGIEPTTPKVELNFGKAVHAAQALRFTREMCGEAGDMAALEAAQRELLTAHFDAHPQPAYEYRNAGRAFELIRAFNAAHPAFDWQVLGVEEKFSVLVGEIEWRGQRVPVYFEGTKDLIVAWHDGLWVVDWKTTKDWNDDLSKNRNLLEGRRSFQFRGYAWAEREAQRLGQAAALVPPETSGKAACDRLTLPVLGTVGFGLVCRQPYTRVPAKPLPREHFHAEPFAFTEGELAEWKASFLDKAAAILRAWSTRNYDMAWGLACGGTGRCPFYDICETRAEDRQAIVEGGTEFQPRTRVEDAASEE